ncbi:putative voltage-gated potassium channel [Paratrimastix pyriformis]|uniref:Voltage-gated potassium channel n=1 Tax=Paratrimastix pyriformis TaxID=342808 RepID=A0ABQ8UK06_9EUKA|nr:putative voltage-gated potassium channel [Paratrimastix pyriformis]
MLQAVTAFMVRAQQQRRPGEERDTIDKPPVLLLPPPPPRPTPFDALYSETLDFKQVQAILLALFDSQATRVGKVIHWAIMALILISCGAFVVETIPSIYILDLPIWFAIECFCMMIFTVEYGARFIAHVPQWWPFVKDPLNMIDLISIVPFYFELTLAAFVSEKFLDVRVVRIIRLSRVLRLFKLGRYSNTLRNVARALRHSVNALALLLFFIGIALVLFSSCLFYFERGHWNPEAMMWVQSDGSPSQFQSIPHGFWWTITTLTTVGYGPALGDVVPKTDAGRVTASIAMICGVLIIAMPSGIVAQEFTKQYDQKGNVTNGTGAASYGPYSPPPSTNGGTSLASSDDDRTSLRSGGSISPSPTEMAGGNSPPSPPARYFEVPPPFSLRPVAGGSRTSSNRVLELEGHIAATKALLRMLEGELADARTDAAANSATPTPPLSSPLPRRPIPPARSPPAPPPRVAQVDPVGSPHLADLPHQA